MSTLKQLVADLHKPFSGMFKDPVREAGEMTMALSAAGLVNNPNVCIKDMGSTLACVCPICIKQVYETFNS